ncbi:MAG TPA: DNA polymerase/3'-5' exonuclease PolX [Deltaproteobacteria bacterium]|nr:DNA polymerase/3'-5' exonuclease PolX [Deltaproteobacteria bacterium]
MEKRPLPTLLDEIAALLEIKGDNPFKVRAYQNAAKVLSTLSDDLNEIVKQKRLKDIKGIGATISAKIEEYIETGGILYHEELQKELPLSLLGLLQIPNLGPRKIKSLYDELNIRNVGELEYACKENRLISLFGFGEKTQEKILKGIEFFKRHQGEYLFGEIYPLALSIKERFRGEVSAEHVEVCGSLRRKKEIVRDIDLLVSSSDWRGVSELFRSMPQVQEVIAEGPTKTSCRLFAGIEADLRVVSPESFPSAFIYFTGSKEHNVKLRGIAKRKGLKLNEYGLFEDEEALPCADEVSVYGALGLSFIPPELREDMGEIEAAENGRVPDLVRPEDIQGLFHVHSAYSDGRDSIEEIADAARQLGLTYVGISDHSRSAFYAGGLKVDDVLRQWDEIDRFNARGENLHIFKGIESDILPDGSLDYDEKILEGFDFVIGSIHSSFGMAKEDMERRIEQAMMNPFITMFGHPTGRLLLARDGYQVDMIKVIDQSAQNNVIIELNASMYRLDVDWRYLKYAREKGVMCSINPDAHATKDLSDLFYGVGIARKGWQERKDVLNTRNVEEVKAIFERIKNVKRHAVCS